MTTAAATSLKAKLDELQKKAKERTVKTQTIEYDLETLVKKLNKDTITLDPEYQRRHRWSDKTSSGLIESLILNIPIPLIYISQDIDVDTEIAADEARYSVIDGQQRMTAIKNFINNKFSLKGLSVLGELNGLYYKDLPPFLVRRLEERTLRCLRIDSTLDEQVKYDIFERLNSGSVKLEPQELRNSIYRGRFNDLAKNLAEDAAFRTLLQISRHKPEKNKKVQKMNDVELVVRFFALSGGNYKKARKGFQQFLSEEMERMNGLPDEVLSQMKQEFLTTMSTILETFGRRAFAKFRKTKTRAKLMSKFNSAVFDALAVATHDISTNAQATLPADAAAKFNSLFADKQFFESVEGSVNDFKKIKYRIEAATAVFGAK